MTDRRADEFAALAVHRHRRDLQRLAATLLNDPAAAQDAVQDTIEAVLRLRPTFADDAAVLRYARTAVLNRARSVLRRRAVHRRFLARTRADVEAPADEALVRADEHRTVLAQFDRLPQRQREVLTLRHFALLADAEIARTLEISVGTVRSNASRGLANLARLIEENADD